MAKSLVGIIGNSDFLEGDFPVQTCARITIEAIGILTNAIPVMIPSLPQYTPIDDLIGQFSGFVFTGGRANIHPHEYGEKVTAVHGFFDRNRDRLTLPLIRKCVDKSIPVLGICRGFQEFNVAFGGSLHPEVRDLNGRMNHRMPSKGTLAEKFALRHEVILNEGSIFADIFGCNIIVTNSLHGQAIKNKGDRVIIEGIARDTTPEAIRIDGAKSFALAVQWHPEWQAPSDPVSKPLFEAFGQALA